jgi:DNA-directed RNA polymerase specialized sigma24 family protein
MNTTNEKTNDTNTSDTNTNDTNTNDPAAEPRVGATADGNTPGASNDDAAHGDIPGNDNPTRDDIAGNDNATRSDIPSNDNAVHGGIPDTTKFVARPDVAQYIRSTLWRCGIPSQDMPDAIAEVQADSIEAARARGMPATVGQWKALAATIAVRWAIDQLREAEVRDKYDAGLCDDADAYLRPTLHWEHRDPVDTKRYLAILKDLFDSGQMPEHGAEILWGEAEEVPHEEIAAEIGISTTAVDNRLSRMRARFRARLAALGMLPVLLLLLVALLTRAPVDDVAAPAPSTKPVELQPRCIPAWDAGAGDASEKSSSPVRGNCALPD